MTRDDVGARSSWTERNPSATKGVSRRGPAEDIREGEDCLLWLVLNIGVFFFGTSFQTRLCTTHPYINMSSSCRNRADRGEPSFSPPPLPLLSKLLRSRVKVKRAVVIRCRTWRLPVKTCLSKSLLSREDTAGTASSSWAFRLLALNIANNSSRKFVPGRFIDGIITLETCLCACVRACIYKCACILVDAVLFATTGRFVCGQSIPNFHKRE